MFRYAIRLLEDRIIEDERWIKAHLRSDEELGTLHSYSEIRERIIELNQVVKILKESEVNNGKKNNDNRR